MPVFRLAMDCVMTSSRIVPLAAAAIVSVTLLPFLSRAASAQDVRGLENCSVEKQAERRTSCLQSNVEFLHQAIARQTREAHEKLAAAGREIAALGKSLSGAGGEIAALKEAVAGLQARVMALEAARKDK